MTPAGQEVAPEKHSSIPPFSVCLSAAFFQDCISEQDLDEMNIEIIRNTLYKVKLDQSSLEDV